MIAARSDILPAAKVMAPAQAVVQAITTPVWLRCGGLRIAHEYVLDRVGDRRVLARCGPQVGVVFLESYWLRDGDSRSEVELAALLAAGGGVVEAPEVASDRVEVEAGFFLDFAAQGGIERFAWFDVAAGEFVDAPMKSSCGRLRRRTSLPLETTAPTMSFWTPSRRAPLARRANSCGSVMPAILPGRGSD
jgi:hypothetical protein